MSKTTQRIVMDPVHPDDHVLGRMAEIIRGGGLVAFPTETVYGLAALPGHDLAVEKIRFIKQGRPQEKFSLCVSSCEQAEQLAERFSPLEFRLMQRFWPGPLTLVVTKADAQTVGLRMPDHPIALRLIEKVNAPVMAPSANFPGQPPPVTADEVLHALDGKIDAVIDAGPARIKQSSTVCQCTADNQVTILRPGAVAYERLEHEAQYRYVLFVCTGNSCRSPMAEGLMKKRVADMPQIIVRSAGVAAYDGMGPSDEAVYAVRGYDVDISGHRARRLTDAMIKESDMMLVMEPVHKRHIISRVPYAEPRVFLLKEFSARGDGVSIPDPIGMGAQFYERVAAIIDEAIEGVVSQIR